MWVPEHLDRSALEPADHDFPVMSSWSPARDDQSRAPLKLDDKALDNIFERLYNSPIKTQRPKSARREEDKVDEEEEQVTLSKHPLRKALASPEAVGFGLIVDVSGEDDEYVELEEIGHSSDEL